MSSINLYAGDESKEYELIGTDTQGREVEINVKADTKEQAMDRATESAADYNIARVSDPEGTRSGT